MYIYVCFCVFVYVVYVSLRVLPYFVCESHVVVGGKEGKDQKVLGGCGCVGVMKQIMNCIGSSISNCSSRRRRRGRRSTTGKERTERTRDSRGGGITES